MHFSISVLWEEQACLHYYPKNLHTSVPFPKKISLLKIGLCSLSGEANFLCWNGGGMKCPSKNYTVNSLIAAVELALVFG